MFYHPDDKCVYIDSTEKSMPEKKKFNICSSVYCDESCKFGEDCIYAHNESEISPDKCIHKAGCNKVRFYKGKYTNRHCKQASDYCGFIHPGESQHDFWNRQLDFWRKPSCEH